MIRTKGPPGNVIYHALNRRNGRTEIFHEVQDYKVFLRLLADVHREVRVGVLFYCLMPNH